MAEERAMGMPQASLAGLSQLEVSKVLRNTYMLLGMTLLFSAVTAGISMAMQLPYMMGLVFSIAGLVTLFVVNKKADSASGLPCARAGSVTAKKDRICLARRRPGCGTVPNG